MSAKKGLPPLTSAQLELMNVLWDQREGTVASVWHELRDKRGFARNTVQTTLVRLEEKGYLRHREQGNAFVYTPTCKRTTVQGGMVRSLLETAFEGSVSGLIMTLLNKERPTEEEIERIQQMLDKHREAQDK
ncbi:BlaI/MecI/CopY family transcriptional regulator [Planctomycetota bacterium]